MKNWPIIIKAFLCTYVVQRMHAGLSNRHWALSSASQKQNIDLGKSYIHSQGYSVGNTEVIWQLSKATESLDPLQPSIPPCAVPLNSRLQVLCDFLGKCEHLFVMDKIHIDQSNCYFQVLVLLRSHLATWYLFQSKEFTGNPQYSVEDRIYYKVK